jgi:hypothetical protein
MRPIFSNETPRLIGLDRAFNRAPCNRTNPEQLFAAGWSACFLSAMTIAAARMKVAFPVPLAVGGERGRLCDGRNPLRRRRAEPWPLTLKPDQWSSERMLAGKDSSGI